MLELAISIVRAIVKINNISRVLLQGAQQCVSILARVLSKFFRFGDLRCFWVGGSHLAVQVDPLFCLAWLFAVFFCHLFQTTPW